MQRDLRDPVLLGEHLLDLRTALPNAPLSLMYDKYAKYLQVSDYSHDESTVQSTIEAYRQKMQEQAVEGDAFALRVLLDKGWEVPSCVDRDLLARAREMRSAADEVLDV